EERWPSCRAFVEALATAGQERETPRPGKFVKPPPVQATAPARKQPSAQSAPEPPPPRSRRHWLAGAAILLVLACLPLALMMFGGNAEPEKKGKIAEKDGQVEALARQRAVQTEKKARLLVDNEHDYQSAVLLLETIHP